MPQYDFELYRQYCESVGKKFQEINIIFDNYFITWLEELSKKTQLYREYLDSIGVAPDKLSSIEVDKGKYDTIGKDFVTIVSPYAETLNLANANLRVNDETPKIICNYRAYIPDKCDLFLTHNPFYIETVKKIIAIHNMGINVCLGIYGNLSDKDSLSKLNALKNYINSMTNNVEFYYDTKDSNYFSCIKSNQKIREKVLIR